MNPETILLFVHPPVAIICYLFVIINAIYTFSNGKRKHMELSGQAAWYFCLGGLVTGMIWAQIAWGTYWSWDPKENATLVLFLSLSCYLLVLNAKQTKRNKKLLKVFTVLNIVMVLVTLFVSPALGGLHAHYYSLPQQTWF